MRITLLAAAVSAALSLVPRAGAQPTFEPRVGFNTTHQNNRVPFPGTLIFYHENEPLPLQLLFGGFGAQGFTSRGMFNFLGTVTLSDPAFVGSLPLAAAPLRPPYNFGNAQGGGTTITFDVVRSPIVNVPWPLGAPRPDETYVFPAHEGGPDEYFAGLRFFFDPGPHQDRLLTVHVEGHMQMISEWFFLSGQEGGTAEMIPIEVVDRPVDWSFQIFFIPAPGAGALAVLAGLAAGRRRR